MLNKKVMAWVLILMVGFSMGCGGAGTGIPAENEALDQTPEQPAPAPAPPVEQPDPVPAPEVEQPEPGSTSLQTSRATNWEQYGLPAMNASQFVEGKDELPKVYVFGINPGTLIWGTETLSYLATDLLGINLMVLVIDGVAVAMVEDSILRYDWDTSPWVDGSHQVEILLRDNGNNFAICAMKLSTDNATDRQAPEISVTGVTSVFQGQPVDSEKYGVVPTWDVCGLTHISLTATDASKIKSLSLIERGYSWDRWGEIERHWGEIVWNDPVTELVLGETNGTPLEVDYNPLERRGEQILVARAEDVLGHVTETVLHFYYYLGMGVTGKVTDSDGQPIKDAMAYIMPAGWELSDGNVEELKLDWYKTKLGGYIVLTIPFGDSTLFITSGDKQRVVPLYIPPLSRTDRFYRELAPEQTRLE